MKRPWLILFLGVLVAVGGFACVYCFATATQRSIAQSPEPELAWLKREYHLPDDGYNRIAALHTAYQPKCMAMCRQIDAANAKLQSLLLSTNMITPEIKAALAEAAQLRQQCQTAMLEHFYEVSRVMPPEQRQRYLRWVQARTLQPNHLMSVQSAMISTNQ